VCAMSVVNTFRSTVDVAMIAIVVAVRLKTHSTNFHSRHLDFLNLFC